MIRVGGQRQMFQLSSLKVGKIEQKSLEYSRQLIFIFGFSKEMKFIFRAHFGFIRGNRGDNSAFKLHSGQSELTQ